ncbi:hypothetical protein LI014_08195 [Clostridium perfringens]|uniref:hypothetical protein n=1 Tax=Clostridium perfringens TaxID=1502 RepID=UPI002246A00E|nr:hypothetical protein [Clostridium perfringens]MCX0397359.1 hypothetical protein [Clostridium perfringens]
MRKLVSLLLSIGILSGTFIGCGRNNQKEVSDNENSSNISSEEKNNKEEVKTDNKESKDSENDTKAKKEEKSSENKEVVTVKDGVITIPKGFKIAEITFDYNRKNIVELNEIENYSDLDKENILGAIIGTNPLEVGNIDGDWNYNTFLMHGLSLRYPNFFEIQKSEMPDLECGITLKSKDKKIEFSAGLNDNHDGKTAKDELDIENKCNEKDSKILISNLEGNTYTFAYEKNGLIIYEYGIVEGPDSDIPVFIYRYPAKYKDTFDKIIEESKKSFVPTKGFPREVNNNSNKVNDKKSNNVQSNDNTETIDIKKYRLTPEEAINLFYKKDADGLKAEKNVSEYLNKNYGSDTVGTFMQHQLEVFDNVENLAFYLGKMSTDLDPLFFIGDKPIYQFEGWSNEGHVFYRDGNGNLFVIYECLDAFNEGNLYVLEGNKKIKVTKKPNIVANNHVYFKD